MATLNVFSSLRYLPSVMVLSKIMTVNKKKCVCVYVGFIVHKYQYDLGIVLCALE